MAQLGKCRELPTRSRTHSRRSSFTWSAKKRRLKRLAVRAFTLVLRLRGLSSSSDKRTEENWRHAGDRPVERGDLSILEGFYVSDMDNLVQYRLFRFLKALGRDVAIVIRTARHEGGAETRAISA